MSNWDLFCHVVLYGATFVAAPIVAAVLIILVLVVLLWIAVNTMKGLGYVVKFILWDVWHQSKPQRGPI